ncbi:DUF2975 domain-containing protein [Levilactobacillus mulengensis]|uniref:DUF2975 domain-containing protein n=1 Tax=Levilactobacillus mulengensis TaxID=2486025 RepID=UPI001CDCAE38|nr:DUF2975 domain-containing protein [Levilactobacillus mulengensis]
MSKWLKIGINVLIMFLRFGIVAGYFMLIYPIIYLADAFQNHTTHAILNGSDFLRFSNNQQATLGAVKRFPSWPYALIMSVGVVLTVWATIKLLKALIKLLSNIRDQNYFSTSNELALITIIKAQVMMLLGDLLFASGNQLSQSWLLRVNTGVFSETWETCFHDVFQIIMLAAIYETYRHAMRVKAENDLTV